MSSQPFGEHSFRVSQSFATLPVTNMRKMLPMTTGDCDSEFCKLDSSGEICEPTFPVTQDQQDHYSPLTVWRDPMSVMTQKRKPKSMIQGKEFLNSGGKLINVEDDYHDDNITHDVVEEAPFDLARVCFLEGRYYLINFIYS